MLDLFATRWNRQLRLFVSPILDPLAWTVDALAVSWEGLVVYAYPPTMLGPKVLQKLRGGNTVLLLMALFSWSRSWTTDLRSLVTNPTVRLPAPHEC